MRQTVANLGVQQRRYNKCWIFSFYNTYHLTLTQGQEKSTQTTRDSRNHTNYTHFRDDLFGSWKTRGFVSSLYQLGFSLKACSVLSCSPPSRTKPHPPAQRLQRSGGEQEWTSSVNSKMIIRAQVKTQTLRLKTKVDFYQNPAIKQEHANVLTRIQTFWLRSLKPDWEIQENCYQKDTPQRNNFFSLLFFF